MVSITQTNARNITQPFHPAKVLPPAFRVNDNNDVCMSIIEIGSQVNISKTNWVDLQ